MNLTLLPLLIVALMLASVDSETETVELILAGQQQIEDHRGALIVGDAEVEIPPDVEVPGPIYVIGGELTVSGAVSTDVIQLAGTVDVAPGGRIGDELRLVGGTQSVSEDADIGRTTSVEVNPATGDPVMGFAFNATLSLLLAWIGSWFARRKSHLLDNVAGAAISHPLVSLTVGTLVVLTALAVIVFMAFTLILLPVALAGLIAGVATVGYGIVAWGHIVGGRLPVRRRGLATALGVLLAVVVLQLLSRLPLLGVLGAGVLVLTAIGAAIVTYYGIAPFRPASLTD